MSKTRKLRINLQVLLRPLPNSRLITADAWSARCLELNLVRTGRDREYAVASLYGAVEIEVERWASAVPSYHLIAPASPSHWMDYAAGEFVEKPDWFESNCPERVEFNRVEVREVK